MFWLKKERHQRWKTHDFTEHPRKSDVLENSKIYYVRFPRNGLFILGIFILVEVDEMYKYLKAC